MLYLTKVASLQEASTDALSTLQPSLPPVKDKFFDSLMNSPLLDQLFSNPEIMKNILGGGGGNGNSPMKKIYEKNPELEQMMNDPALMKETLKALRNPEYQKEMMRNNDRALSNLEIIPEGFNALRKAYSSIQEPMMQALDDSLQLKLKDDIKAIDKSKKNVLFENIDVSIYLGSASSDQTRARTYAKSLVFLSR